MGLSDACAIGPFRRFIATWRLGCFQRTGRVTPTRAVNSARDDWRDALRLLRLNAAGSHRWVLGLETAQWRRRNKAIAPYSPGDGAIKRLRPTALEMAQ